MEKAWESAPERSKHPAPRAPASCSGETLRGGEFKGALEGALLLSELLFWRNQMDGMGAGEGTHLQPLCATMSLSPHCLLQPN